MTLHIDQWREARLMATRIAASLDHAGCRYVLVTSPSKGEGKTRLVDLLRREFEALAWTRYRFLSWDALRWLKPGDIGRDQVAIVDGPPLVEGAGILELPPAWMKSFDGAVLVVRKRRTTRDDLAQSVAWLRATGIEPVGIVWSEHGFPPLRQILLRLRERLLERRRTRDLRRRKTTRPVAVVPPQAGPGTVTPAPAEPGPLAPSSLASTPLLEEKR